MGLYQCLKAVNSFSLAAAVTRINGSFQKVKQIVKLYLNHLISSGGQESDETKEQSALRESWEEAGLKGQLGPCLGQMEHPKGHTLFTFYIMHVDSVATEWPEMRKRKRLVLDIDQGVELVSKKHNKHFLDVALGLLEGKRK